MFKSISGLARPGHSSRELHTIRIQITEATLGRDSSELSATRSALSNTPLSLSLSPESRWKEHCFNQPEFQNASSTLLSYNSRVLSYYCFRDALVNQRKENNFVHLILLTVFFFPALDLHTVVFISFYHLPFSINYHSRREWSKKKKSFQLHLSCWLFSRLKHKQAIAFTENHCFSPHNWCKFNPVKTWHQVIISTLGNSP